ncbi:thioredoxin [Pseudobacteriovorax antillogorgiicola]|uniref:Thioredoxin n=1 Tax=Pseudobacteriovorax antillogorgiicola TaxID=1513793 RepID=A0A1Y6CJK5_9BACT|nr:thioredoxin [Pseudobacteriovorax antillogorgiicola]TCS46194.1 thioredoxin [Pseudobacteriovorax antillogorgiicola]SMF70139.1 thioredoxin [Pseudobacteriovorax antillogorgiicola]
MAGYVQEVSDADFESRVIENQRPCLVDFWAPWCGPCQMIGPVLDKLAQEFEGDVDIFKMNVDANSTVPQGMGVRSIPYLVTFKNGELKDTIVGAPDPQKLVDLMENLLEE